MYTHHKESLQIMLDYFQQKPETIAVVFGGSVAKGCEREDSDLDAIIVVSRDAYEKRAATNTTTETITGMCTYEGGYFDVKYITKEILEETAQKGSEPARNAFVKSRVLYSLDPDIPDIVSRIPVFQEGETADKMLSFYSNLYLNYYYFWKSCPIDGYMKVHAANEIIYSIYRMILQQNKILFPCNRRLEEFIAAAPDKPEQIVELAAAFIKALDDAACDSFVNAFLNWTSYEIPQNNSNVLTRYTQDFEQWWRIPRPLVAEW